MRAHLRKTIHRQKNVSKTCLLITVTVTVTVKVTVTVTTFFTMPRNIGPLLPPCRFICKERREQILRCAFHHMNSATIELKEEFVNVTAESRLSNTHVAEHSAPCERMHEAFESVRTCADTETHDERSKTVFISVLAQ